VSARARVVVLGLAVALAVSGAVASDEGAAEASYREGARALAAGDYAAAASALERAVQADPSSARTWLKLGLARAGLQDSEGAIAAYRKAIEIAPEDARALNNLANVYFRQGRYEEAADWYRRALDVDPDYLLAAYHYGWVLRQLNRPEEAEREFRHCLELPAENDRERRTQLDSLYYLGTLRFRANDFATAASMMERVLAAFPAHPEARYYLGMAYRRLGRDAEAREQLELHAQMLRSTRGRPIERQPDP